MFTTPTDTAAADGLAERLSLSHIWSVHLDPDLHPPLCWQRVVAALLRDLQVAEAATLFARVIEQTVELIRDAAIAGATQGEPAVLRFEDWLAQWWELRYDTVLDRELGELATRYPGDIAYGLEALADRDALPEASLLFLAGAVAFWLEAERDLAASVVARHPWLRIVAGLPAEDAIEAVLRHFYGALGGDRRILVEPLPETFSAIADAGDNGLYAPRHDLARSMPRTLNEIAEGGDWREVLGAGVQWFSAAVHLATARRGGIVATGLSLTEGGRKLVAAMKGTE